LLCARRSAIEVDGCPTTYSGERERDAARQAGGVRKAAAGHQWVNRDVVYDAGARVARRGSRAQVEGGEGLDAQPDRHGLDIVD
jgi:hypothetical protein